MLDRRGVRHDIREYISSLIESGTFLKEQIKPILKTHFPKEEHDWLPDDQELSNIICSILKSKNLDLPELQFRGRTFTVQRSRKRVRTDDGEIDNFDGWSRSELIEKIMFLQGQVTKVTEFIKNFNLQ